MNANSTARVEVPADHRWGHVVRAVVAAIADPAAFDIDRLNDLDLAVAETTTTMFDDAGGRRLVVETDRRDGGLRVEMRLESDPGEADPADTPLLGYVLEGLATDVTRSPGHVGFTVHPR